MRIDPAGWPFIAIGIGVAAFVAVAAGSAWGVAALVFPAFFLFFFRDPERHVQAGPGELVSPADGRVMVAGEATGSFATGAWEPAQEATVVGPVSGRAAIVDGPYTEAKELVGGFVLVEEKSREDAVAGAEEFVQFHLDNWPGWNGWSEVRQVYE